MHHPPDPSWCARINAHRAPPPAPEPAPTPAPPSSAAAESSPSTPRTPPSRSAPAASPFTPRQTPTRHECELCGTVMYDHNCKIVCPNCGYKRDCSDP